MMFSGNKVQQQERHWTRPLLSLIRRTASDVLLPDYRDFAF
jgi:hypothetical protein